MVLASESKIVLYGLQAAKLLPRGILWTVRAGSVWEGLLRGLGAEMGNVDERVVDYLRESDPRTSDELIPDWERVLNIPGTCGNLEETSVARRFQIVSKLTAQGGQSISYFVSVALSLGFAVTIEEFPMAETGVTVCGDELNGEDCRFVWTIHAPSATPFFFRIGESGAGDPLVASDVTVLECTIQDLRPAQSELFFEYDLPPAAGSYAPWETFTPTPSVVPLAAPPVQMTTG